MTAGVLLIREHRIRLLAMDVDGVLTDGGVFIHEDETQSRRFDIKDGLGIKRVLERGVEVALISSASCRAVQYRAEMLGIKEVHLNVSNKIATLRELCTRLDTDLSEVCYIGDDLVDLEVLHSVGFPCAPADAVSSIRQIATYVTQARGGRGAVREVCDLLLGSPS